MRNIEIDKFIEVMSPIYPMVYRTISTTWIPKTVSESYALTNKEDNVYFLGWVNPDAERTTDADIGIINYIRLDIDIKKWVIEAYWTEPNKEDIIDIINEIKESIDSNEHLKDWSYIVMSWGGCHIYYSNKKGINIDKEVTPKVWQLAMRRIYELYDSIMEEEYKYSDKAVCNTARIMRLPWTINQKNWLQCTIIYARPDQQSPLLGHVKALGQDALNKTKLLSTKRAREITLMREQLIANGGWDTDLKYEIINKMPAYLLAQILLPQFKFDNKKNFKNWWKLKWYYFIADTNSICNWWSAEFAWWSVESCWNNFSLIQRQLNLTNAETFKWFEEKFLI